VFYNIEKEEEYDDEVISDAYKNSGFNKFTPFQGGTTKTIYSNNVNSNTPMEVFFGNDIMTTINQILPSIDLLPAIGMLFPRFMKQGLDLGFEMIPIDSVLRDVYEEKLEKKNAKNEGVTKKVHITKYHIKTPSGISGTFMAPLQNNMKL
jgi:hypothetical protein